MNTQAGSTEIYAVVSSFFSKWLQVDRIQRKIINGSWIQTSDGIISDVNQLEFDTKHPTMVGHTMIISGRG